MPSPRARLRSGTLVAWVSAWLSGQGSLDDVVHAVSGNDAPHRIAGLSGPTAPDDPVPLHELLVRLRRLGAAVRLVLPVAGDVRGLPGPAAFRSAALDAGQAVLGGALGLVPLVTDHAPSSAPPTVLWQVAPIDPPPPDHLSLADAQFDLAQAIRDSASALTASDATGWLDDVTADLHNARRASERLDLPPGFPPRAVALLAQAERLQAVLDIACGDPAGAPDPAAAAARAETLRPLATAVRRARVAGYNALST